MQLHARMAPRDPEERNRTATPLELFFDLTFVVAVAQASASLHHGLIAGHVGDALVSFAVVFFAVWWAWVNITWFGSAYDTDDAPYRVAVFMQMAGVLILAAGVPRAFDSREYGIVALGFVVMRLALVAQWLRVARSYPEGRTCALRYAGGIILAQTGWLVWSFMPDSLFLVVFAVLVAFELAVPMYAEAAARTSWHPGHIAERYSLFTIIVLGESLLAASLGVQQALDTHSVPGDLATVVVGGLLTVFSMWWIYFDMPTETAVERARRDFGDRLTGAFTWGYGHYFVFAGAAATGAGLAVAVDQATRISELTDAQAALAFTLPVSIYLAAVWAIHYRHGRRTVLRIYAVPITVGLILASTLTPEPVLLTGLLMALLVATHVVFSRPD